MTPDELTFDGDKVRENRLRRMAARQGYKLIKSRRRDPRAIDYGTYGIIDPNRNWIVASSGGGAYGLGLDDVEAFLTGDDRNRQDFNGYESRET